MAPPCGLCFWSASYHHCFWSSGLQASVPAQSIESLPLLLTVAVMLSFTGPIIGIVSLVNRLLIKKYRTDALKFLVRERLDDNIKEAES